MAYKYDVTGTIIWHEKAVPRHTQSCRADDDDDDNNMAL
jgi:hypothetical protein